eukprot:TRINITY_DN2250_c0_g2_i2.p1 TRINITY_DN2250_c0_g2~~TRINITY_DN2250_c0_g2_i2.p1  ORF type:complete len:401 (+),score=80.39 TRINITY_DN2250_c0_g2_i2:117-1319(+)
MELLATSTSSDLDQQLSFPYNITFSNVLPKEVILHVLSFLKSESDLYRISLVNWDLQLLSIDDTLWKGIYTQNWIPILEHRLPYSYEQYAIVTNTLKVPTILSEPSQLNSADENDKDSEELDEDCARDGEVRTRVNSGRWKLFYRERKKLKSRKGLHEFIQLLQTLLKHPQQFDPKILMVMYTTVFSFCVVVDRTREFGFDHKGLYQLLVDLSTQHLQGLMTHINTHHPLKDIAHSLHNILVLYRTHWKLWKVATHKVTSIFGYFHRERIAKQTYFEWGAFKILDKVFPEILGVQVMMMKCWYYIVYKNIEEALSKTSTANLDNLDSVLLKGFYKSFSEMECDDLRRPPVEGERRLNLGNAEGLDEEGYNQLLQNLEANEPYNTWNINNMDRMNWERNNP